MRACTCVYVRACVRAFVRACVRVYVCFLFFSSSFNFCCYCFFLSSSLYILLLSRCCFWSFSSSSLLYSLFNWFRIFTLTFHLCVSLVCVHMFIRVKTLFLYINKSVNMQVWFKHNLFHTQQYINPFTNNRLCFLPRSPFRKG